MVPRGVQRDDFRRLVSSRLEQVMSRLVSTSKFPVSNDLETDLALSVKTMEFIGTFLCF